jgi:hypothetical protein
MEGRFGLKASPVMEVLLALPCQGSMAAAMDENREEFLYDLTFFRLKLFGVTAYSLTLRCKYNLTTVITIWNGRKLPAT